MSSHYDDSCRFISFLDGVLRLLKSEYLKPLQIKAFLKNLPGSNSLRTDYIKTNPLFDQNTNTSDHFHLLDDVEFGQILAAKGRKSILFLNEAQAVLDRRRRNPKQPLIQQLLKRAFELKEQLDKTKGLTRDALAKKVGLDPSYLTRILNLLNLHPEIQQHILSMPPAIKRGPLTERRLIPIARTRDRQGQLETFRRLLAMPARAKKILPSSSLKSIPTKI